MLPGMGHKGTFFSGLLDVRHLHRDLRCAGVSIGQHKLTGMLRVDTFILPRAPTPSPLNTCPALDLSGKQSKRERPPVTSG